MLFNPLNGKCQFAIFKGFAHLNIVDIGEIIDYSAAFDIIM
jgi:hypothetical protein